MDFLAESLRMGSATIQRGCEPFPKASQAGDLACSSETSVLCTPNTPHSFKGSQWVSSGAILTFHQHVSRDSWLSPPLVDVHFCSLCSCVILT